MIDFIGHDLLACVSAGDCKPYQLQLKSVRNSGNCLTRTPVAANIALHTTGVIFSFYI
ncbi:hypothetical protein [Methylomonas sp. Kb3]|uniref:hypothetical protein n=1 Tax=Methylomonas sp. Kb3 TaxID=1611544 RepID=UPI0013FD4D82|nr:hypothetical protein [Methylomonas sp. Kb3]